MDLQVGEQVLKRLEDEASRLRGLADLRTQFDDALQSLNQQAAALTAGADRLRVDHQTHETERQRSVDLAQRTVADLQTRFATFSEATAAARTAQAASLESRLTEQSDAIRTGLVQVHKQVQGLALQIDQGVKAELARSLGELRADLSTAVSTLSRQSDLLQREHTQALKHELSETSRRLEESLQAEARQLRTAAIIVGALVVVGVVVLAWLIMRV